ncbi:hypothetical protein [Roseococcus pinisoli]|uniref:DUF1269 domain-containing protein n=1 Tax=Roseococcus pinisoli TaxID=2835040 RepID=A0ABS5Q9G3_9PROT|nr:hypothetical protein [Roseococcus pinisoli]MBS7810349.1 hypothetical protein [Roseococcus pinisoli]
MITVAKVFEDRAAATKATEELDSLHLPGLEVSLAESAEDSSSATRTGSSVGAVLGTGAGVLAGVGALALPGFGPILAAGWFATVLTAAGMGAATGGLIGALTAQGIGETEAGQYSERLRQGGTLVIVRAGDATQASNVESILGRHHPVAAAEATATGPRQS